VVDVERSADEPLQLLHRRLLGRQRADIGAGTGPDQDLSGGSGGRRRNGRGRRQFGGGLRQRLVLVAPQDGGRDAGGGQRPDDEDGDTGTGREETPEHDSTVPADPQNFPSGGLPEY
jgi:hypothetical protein